MATKRTEQPAPFFIPGVFVRFTFLREYKAKTKSTDGQAALHFESCLKNRTIEYVRNSGIGEGLPVYQFKK